MKKYRKPLVTDLLFLGTAGFFFLGCIATAHRTARTLHPGQLSAGTSYMQARSAEEFSQDPIQLQALDMRIGLGGYADLGFAHTWDVSRENENLYRSWWGDVKFQLSNRLNIPGQLTFSTGLLKGRIYDKEIDLHLTTLPLMFEIPASDRLTPYFIFRYELITTTFISFFEEDFENARHTYALGLEYALVKPSNDVWVPRLSFCAGRLNSIFPPEDGDPAYVFNLGLTFDMPYKARKGGSMDVYRSRYR